MKNIFKLTFAALAFMSSMTACDDFGDTNIDPEHFNDGNVNYYMVFTNAQHQALGSDWDVWRNGMIYLSQWNQHIAAGGWWWSYGINSYSDGYAASYWGSVLSGGDRGAIRDIQTVIRLWEGDDAHNADYQIARIVRAYTFQRLTDLHGDIPYFEAGNAAEFAYPKYDTQEAIYDDLLKELDEAQAALGSGTAPMQAHDVYYSGDVSKWKKFANSLLLRTAMRLSKVNPSKAQEWAAKAYSNGVITETADNCYLGHEGGSYSNDSSEPYAKIISHEDQDVPFINKTFYDILAATNDPRIPLIMAVYPEALDAGGTLQKDYIPTAAGMANCAPELQRGLEGFFSMGPTSTWSIKHHDPYYTDEILSDPSSPIYYKKTHSRPNHYTYGDWEAPSFICTAAQTNLLLAEAAYRGWINGDAAQFYADGVRCAMEQFQTYPNSSAKSLCSTYLNEDAIANYLANNPLDATKALEQINTQYWITCFCDEYETYANWRRSGYPVLKEKCSVFDGPGYPGFSQVGNFPLDGNYENAIVRRFPYPTSEGQINTANYNEAVKRLGLNTSESDFNATRVWWDVK